MRFGETHGASCMLTSFKDGKLQTYAHRVDIRELVEEQNKRDNKHINIVTTRINKPHAEYPESCHFYQPAFPTYTYMPIEFEPIYFEPIYFEPIYFFEPI
ncbi:hypothetical protein CHS0354_038794 [Potamilus streckersoni]|uniref:Uncharacterized protein n=1 Tax=Potamilus streckersoni TaxID=2493646 RepID=A0AAE0W685_9BIVA|nr:hypothetical protein CHS0354_038794 [Potamilus streckersoni]